jgi:hypothetical protein
MRSRTRVLIAAAVVALFGVFTAVALAVSPHFISAGASGPDNNGLLTVSWKEAGLGNNQLIDYLAAADGTAVYACINGGSNHPKASNKETVSGPVSTPGSFSSGKNGSISASLVLNPPGAGAFSCPSGQDLVLAFVSYTNVSIADLSNNITEPIPGTFSNCLVSGKLATELCPA